MRPTAFVLLTLASMALALPALGKDKEDRGHGRGGPPGVVVVPSAPIFVAPAAPVVVAPARRVVFSDRDRAIVYDYYRTQYVSVARCPPGLAKKGYACVPPGQVRQRVWVIGQPLPPAVVYEPVPPVVVQQLEPVPDGYGYVRVDNDVILMDMANRVVTDVIGDLYDPYDLD